MAPLAAPAGLVGSAWVFLAPGRDRAERSSDVWVRQAQMSANRGYIGTGCAEVRFSGCGRRNWSRFAANSVFDRDQKHLLHPDRVPMKEK